MKELKFTKMHWIWNDFIMLNQTDLDNNGIKLETELVQKLCHRNFWIWSDGIVIITKWSETDFRYIMYNPDWTIAEMCGNWIRCYMKYLIDNNLSTQTQIDVETWAWILNLDINEDIVTVDMWTPKKIEELNFETNEFWNSFSIQAEDREFQFTPVSMWNPHAVIFLDKWELENFQLEKYWKSVERNTGVFPNKTNAEFIEIISDNEINMRVWERWAGETLACWTWACASVVSWILVWLLNKNEFIKVNLAWWILEVKWSWNNNDSVIMKWPAETSFEWIYYIK